MLAQMLHGIMFFVVKLVAFSSPNIACSGRWVGRAFFGHLSGFEFSRFDSESTLPRWAVHRRNNMRNRFFSCLMLLALTGCANNLAVPITPTIMQDSSYQVIVLNAPPTEMELPDFFEDSGTLYLGGNSELHPKAIFTHESACPITDVTVTYSPDYQYVTIAKGCMASHGLNKVYLLHSDGIGLIRTITGYDSYESGTNRPIEWAPDSKSFIYYRSAGFSDAHIEVFIGIFRYEVETAERKYLAPIWGDYKWSSDGKWIAILDDTSNTECKDLYLLDSDGESLWKLDNVCEDPNAKIEMIWQKTNDSGEVLAVIQKENENQHIISMKEYETASLSSYRQVPIR
jgi:hypothetical protein